MSVWAHLECYLGKRREMWEWLLTEWGLELNDNR